MSGSMLLLPVVVPVLAGLAMLNIVRMKERKIRDCYVGVVLLFCLVVSAWIFFAGDGCEFRFQVTEKLLFLLRQDGLAKVFSIMATAGWIFNGFFSFEYMSKEENQVQFFAFYLITGGFLNGLSYAGSYSTMKLFYILISVTTIPLIIHRQTEKAVRAALYYAAYFLVGLVCIQVGGSYVMRFVTTREFTAGGSLNMAALSGHEGLFLVMVFVLLLGFGIKTCLFPFHGWNRVVSHAAPIAATSAISGILTKTGILAMVRVIGNLIGTDILTGTWVQYVWMVLALISIFIGAVLAFKTDLLAERMAYSTVGQVGCIVFGVSLMNTQALTGALVLMVAHTMAILVLFFTTGAIVFQTGYTKVHELRGIGRQVPQMMFCFALASFVIMGIPPTLGFVGDWSVSLGAMKTGIPYLASAGSVVFVIGELFAAGYFLSITLKGFFPGEAYDYVHENVCRPSIFTRIPAIVLTVLVYVIGFYPAPLLKLIGQALTSMGL